MKFLRLWYGVMVVIWAGALAGCLVWPIMPEQAGYRPLEMGKYDQVMNPWAPQPIHLSKFFGHSVTMANTGQTLNPEASKNFDPTVGQYPGATINAMKRYQKLFAKPPYKAKVQPGKVK